MKKIKAVFMTVAFLTAITAAFAFKAPQDPCSGVTLYYKSGANFIQVPPQGGVCQQTANACKYYNAGTPAHPNYMPCNTGIYGLAPFVPNP